MVTEIAIADELASSAELVMGKTLEIPVAIIRGYKYQSVDLIMITIMLMVIFLSNLFSGRNLKIYLEINMEFC